MILAVEDVNVPFPCGLPFKAFDDVDNFTEFRTALVELLDSFLMRLCHLVGLFDADHREARIASGAGGR